MFCFFLLVWTKDFVTRIIKIIYSPFISWEFLLNIFSRDYNHIIYFEKVKNTFLSRLRIYVPEKMKIMKKKLLAFWSVVLLSEPIADLPVFHWFTTLWHSTFNILKPRLSSKAEYKTLIFSPLTFNTTFTFYINLRSISSNLCFFCN